MTTNHTPTPWRVNTFNGDRQEVLDANGNNACVKANAAFIVRACNAHDELVAALELIDHPNAVRTIEDAKRVARAALAKVQK